MIIVKLSGGLGNQLFQYAFARTLSHKHHVELKLDISGYLGGNTNVTPRSYELGSFNIHADIASSSEVWLFHRNGRLGRLAAKLGSRIIGSRMKYVREPSFNFSPEMMELPDDVYLDGYWQSERYFEQCSSLIRDELKLVQPMNNEDGRLAELINKGNAVAIHIRRGDFFSDPRISSVHGVCGLDYYRRAIAYVAERVENATLFVFSDDMAWAKEHLETDLPTYYVDHNAGKPAIGDFRLMSLCQHQVIANSTFSWWAAWLNSHPGKVVTAPLQWFAMDEYETGDLIPDGWIMM